MSRQECISYLIAKAEELLRNNEPEEAYGVYREIVRREPSPPRRVWLSLATCAKRMGKPEEAAEALKRAGGD